MLCSTWCLKTASSIVSRVGLRLKQRLAALKDDHGDIIEEVRGQGLMLGLKCKVPNQNLLEALRAQKMLTVQAGDNVVRLLPPLIIGEAESSSPPPSSMLLAPRLPRLRLGLT